MRLLPQVVHAAAGPGTALHDVVRREPAPLDRELPRVRRDFVPPGRGAAALARAREPVVCAARVGVGAVVRLGIDRDGMVKECREK